MMCDVVVGAGVPGSMHVMPIFWFLNVWVGRGRSCEGDVMTVKKLAIVQACVNAR